MAFKAAICWGNLRSTMWRSRTFSSSSARLWRVNQWLMQTRLSAKVWSNCSRAPKLGTSTSSISWPKALLSERFIRVTTNRMATAKMNTPKPVPMRHAMFQRHFIGRGRFSRRRGTGRVPLGCARRGAPWPTPEGSLHGQVGAPAPIQRPARLLRNGLGWPVAFR